MNLGLKAIDYFKINSGLTIRHVEKQLFLSAHKIALIFAFVK